MHELLAVRQKIFVVEQRCAYQDADNLDRHSWHLLGANAPGSLVAYGRVNFPGARYREPSFGRVLTARAVRGQGIGHQVVQRCIDKCRLEYPGMAVRIAAQVHLTEFYRHFGFVCSGHPYDDDGIEHIDMVLARHIRGG